MNTMSTPMPVSHPALSTFARSAASAFTDLARQATATGAPGGSALAGLLAAGAAELKTLAADPALAAISITDSPQTSGTGAGGLGALLVVALALQKAITVTLTVASSEAATGEQQSRVVEAAMIAARRQAGLRIAAALAASDQLSLLGTQQLAVLAPDAPGALGAVGTPSAFAPVVVT